MRKREYSYYVADYETTVFEGQTFTEVWAGGFVSMYTENCTLVNSIDKFFAEIFKINKNCKIFFHNVKFDGSFILNWLKKDSSWKEALVTKPDKQKKFKKEWELHHKEYTYLISQKGVWYSITLNYKGKTYEFIDSYKLIPFALGKAGEAFDTKHKKLEMEYAGFRCAGGEIKPDDKQYLMHDLLVAKECVEAMFDNGHKNFTIGSCCMEEFKSYWSKEGFEEHFPNLYNIKAPSYTREESAGEFIHKSYRGAWTYCDERRKDKVCYNGVTVDANSLYPSEMHSKSGNVYPVGNPTFWEGDIPIEAKQKDKYYFVRIKTKFELKPKHLPFIQIKGDLRYKGNEMLKTSKVCDRYGELVADTPVTLTVTQTDLELIKKHYNLTDYEEICGAYFYAKTGIFDDYIDKYMEIKENATDAVSRTLAKLFLNNLYGKFATYIDSSFKVARLEDGVLKFETVVENDKKPGYIPIGSAITSYARYRTISLAQKNYDYFGYADTDSLHCECTESELIDIPIHNSKLLHWKVEKHWQKAFFHRQKTYIECENGEYAVTCAGMGKVCKEVIIKALLNRDKKYDYKSDKKWEKYNNKQRDFIISGMDITDFKKGLKVWGNLKGKQVVGGMLLVEDFFEMRF